MTAPLTSFFVPQGQRIPGSINASSITSQVNDFPTITDGTIVISGGYITGLNDPIVPSGAATRSYVDSIFNNTIWRAPCRVCTTVDIALFGLPVIDGVQTIAGDRVLVKEQTDGIENGYYIASIGIWPRADDMPDGRQVSGFTTLILEGTTLKDLIFTVANDAPNDVVGTDPLVFGQISSLLIAGMGLSQTGNVLNVNVDNTSIEIDGLNQLSLTTTGVTAATYGSATQVPVITVNAEGRLTNVTNTSINVNFPENLQHLSHINVLAICLSSFYRTDATAWCYMPAPNWNLLSLNAIGYKKFSGSRWNSTTQMTTAADYSEWTNSGVMRVFSSTSYDVVDIFLEVNYAPATSNAIVTWNFEIYKWTASTVPTLATTFTTVQDTYSNSTTNLFSTSHHIGVFTWSQNDYYDIYIRSKSDSKNASSSAFNVVFGKDHLLLKFIGRPFGWTQQASALTGTGNTGNAEQGWATAITPSATTLVESGYANNSNVGAFWVWTRTGTGWNATWSQQAGPLIGTGGTGTPQQSYSLAISTDGNTVISGGLQNNSNTGAIWVWTRSGSSWSQQAGPLVGTSAVSNSRFGASVAVSSNGNTAAIGGYSHSASQGAIWIWTRSGSSWTQQAGPLQGTSSAGSQQGWSISISADGNTVVTGGPSANAIWIWTRSGSSWTQQAGPLVGTGNTGNAEQGYSVAMSSDGNTVAVGGRSNNGGAGAIWVWIRSGSSWSQQGSPFTGSGISGAPLIGHSIAISPEGNTIVAGGPNQSGGLGAMWIWTRTAGIWSQNAGPLTGTGNTGSALQGSAVAMSSEGVGSGTAICGGRLNSSSLGAFWVWFNL